MSPSPIWPRQGPGQRLAVRGVRPRFPLPQELAHEPGAQVLGVVRPPSPRAGTLLVPVPARVPPSACPPPPGTFWGTPKYSPAAGGAKAEEPPGGGRMSSPPTGPSHPPPQTLPYTQLLRAGRVTQGCCGAVPCQKPGACPCASPVPSLGWAGGRGDASLPRGTWTRTRAVFFAAVSGQ